uniref:long-chain-fatty-acid--CoA ligase n=1 Tax=Macrostomum lignano TaxID=282301 RepID=A0A1I8I4L2_9PLAT
MLAILGLDRDYRVLLRRGQNFARRVPSRHPPVEQWTLLGYSVGEGPYEWLTYQQVYDQARELGSALTGRLGLSRGEFVGVYSQNRAEWVLTEVACNQFSLVLVPLYDTLGTEACNQLECFVVVDSETKARNLLQCKAEAPSFRHLVKEAQEAGVELHAWSELVSWGRENLAEQVLPPMTPEDTYLSYLPLAHMFERCAITMCFLNGMRVGFFRGDVRQLMEDMQALRPTLFCTVPRLLNRMYDRVLAGVSGSVIKSKLLQMAVDRKTRMLERGIIRRDTMWDKLVFSKVHQLTGGRVRVVITGSAPIGAKVMQFIRAAFGCPVFEGYGQTEATAAVTVTLPGETSLGHVGTPVPCNHVKLVDVPEMGLKASDGRGEVCVRGANVSSGYFRMDDKTAEVLEPDNWLHTGDIGEWTENGCLKIVDRRKHLFKLAQGEYVAPEKIEQLLSRSQYVAQIFVDGDSLEIYVLGIVVPDPDVVLPWAKSHGLPQDLEALCKDPNGPLKRAILEDLNRIGRENGLKGFELCKDIMLCAEQFSVENGLLTPTFKSRRPDLRVRFRDDFKRMYDGLRASSSAAA